MLIQEKPNSYSNSLLLRKQQYNPCFKGLFSNDKFQSNKIDISQDIEYKQLRDIAQKVKKDRKQGDFLELLNIEEKILWQEVENPAKHIPRAFAMRVMLYDILAKSGEEKYAKLRYCALEGLVSHYRTYKLLKLPAKDQNPIFPVLESLIANTKDTSPYAEKIKHRSMVLIDYIYDNLNPEYQKRAQDLSINILKESPFDSCRNRANEIFLLDYKKNKRISEEFIETIRNQYSDPNVPNKVKKTALTNLGMLKMPELKKIIPDILNNDNAEDSMKLTAAWCAGRVQTKKNFQLLKKIINSSDEKANNLELKEIALQSFALYLREYPEKVRSTLKKISKSDSDLKELAQILSEKAQGTYNIRNRFINESLSTKEDQEKYNNLKNGYFIGLEKLNPRQSNLLDEGLKTLNNVLKKLVDKREQFFIIDDSVTGIDRDSVGQRANDGIFYDTVTGMNYEHTSVIGRYEINRPLNVIAHEFNHSFEANILDAEDKSKLGILYDNAKEDNKCLDVSASTTVHEYFATGYEAYVSVYKPHKTLIFRNYLEPGLAHTKLELKNKDPELYDFIEHCIQKYNNPQAEPANQPVSRP